MLTDELGLAAIRRMTILPVLDVAPGLGLCAMVAAGAMAAATIEKTAAGTGGLGPVLWALLFGMAVRTFWTPSEIFEAGVVFTARKVLELAVMLFGALLSFASLLALDPVLAAGIPTVVIATLGLSYGIGRALGVSPRVAALIASGNAICGNSAIAAAKTVTGATPAETSASIALTALPALAVTLALPTAAILFGLEGGEYGLLAGLVVYAIPQVLAATAPFSALSVQVGLLVKLTRVLMLGPVMVFWSLLFRGDPSARQTSILRRMFPWYVVGFAALAAARGSGIVPQVMIEPISAAAGFLTVLAMAALGLETDLQALRRYGVREMGAVAASLSVLILLSVGLMSLA